MDPVSIVGTAFSLAGNILKATGAIAEFTRDVHDATKDLNCVSRELQAINGILDPLSRILRARRDEALPRELTQQVGDTLEGCSIVVSELTQMLRKHQRDRVWTKMRWALFGQGDVEKLRDSLEAYKMALSIGLSAVSMWVPFPLPLYSEYGIACGSTNTKKTQIHE